MLNCEAYMHEAVRRLRDAFGTRLLYVGLQGSYLRGEAKEESDIDLMVVIDSLTKADLDLYREVIAVLGSPELSCGFLCGGEELRCWNPLELCHLAHSTKDYFGSLSSILPVYKREDHLHYVQLSLGNLYHALCHRYVHADAEKNRRKLPMHEKELFFLLRDLYYLKTGAFAQNRAALQQMLTPQDLALFRMVAYEAAEPDYDFDGIFSAVFSWCQRTLAELSGEVNK